MHSWYVLYETVEVASWSGYGPAWVDHRVMGEWVVGQSDRVCGVFSDLLWIYVVLSASHIDNAPFFRLRRHR